MENQALLATYFGINAFLEYGTFLICNLDLSSGTIFLSINEVLLCHVSVLESLSIIPGEYWFTLLFDLTLS